MQNLVRAESAVEAAMKELAARKAELQKARTAKAPVEVFVGNTFHAQFQRVTKYPVYEEDLLEQIWQSVGPIEVLPGEEWHWRQFPREGEPTHDEAQPTTFDRPLYLVYVRRAYCECDQREELVYRRVEVVSREHAPIAVEETRHC
jgi:hypothetical protein